MDNYTFEKFQKDIEFNLESADVTVAGKVATLGTAILNYETNHFNLENEAKENFYYFLIDKAEKLQPKIEELNEIIKNIDRINIKKYLEGLDLIYDKREEKNEYETVEQRVNAVYGVAFLFILVNYLRNVGRMNNINYSIYQNIIQKMTKRITFR